MDNKSPIHISSIELKTFRCFDHLTLDLNAPYILLEGANGVGKTSILEALYYACYLRSFRTYSPRELVAFNADGFFVKIGVRTEDTLSHDIQIGFSHNKRLVKVDQKPIGSYKELMSYYRIISLTEDDLELIKGSPQYRRSFIDQMLLLLDPACGSILKSFRQVVDQRNAFLHRPDNSEMYRVLTRQLWEYSFQIEAKRREVLSQLEERVRQLRERFIGKELTISLNYYPKKRLEGEFERFFKQSGDLKEKEGRFRRSLFGAHLDDIRITLSDRYSRIYASRGQQKLILLLLKIAQLQLLLERGCPSIFILDDYMTDFDEIHAAELIDALESLDCQLIFTSPSKGGYLTKLLKKRSVQVVSLTHRNNRPIQKASSDAKEFDNGA